MRDAKEDNTPPAGTEVGDLQQRLTFKAVKGTNSHVI